MNFISTILWMFVLLSLMVQSAELKNCDDPDCKVDSLIINTGYDHLNGQAFPVGTTDPYWELIESPNQGLTLPSPAFTISANQAWINPPANSQWISAYNFSNFNQNNIPPDDPYTFQFCFCACEGVDSIEINMQVFVDNTAKILLNNDSIFNFSLNNSVSTFQQGEFFTGRFAVTPGEQCLQIEMRNWSSVAMGLLVNGAIKSVAKEGSDPLPVFLSQACCNPNGSIFGRKINDKNCNGIDDNSPNNPNIEPGLAGWEITLNPGNITTTTDANGYYYFNNLPPGNYTVSETQQTGWTQTLPTQGSYSVTLNPKDIIQLDFANCEKQAPPCDEMGELFMDDDCCQANFSLNNSIGSITHINYYVTGGTLEDIFISPCAYTTNPSNVNGTTSGTISYTNPCNDVQQFIVKANSTTASGVIGIQWVVYHGDADSCVYDTRFICERAPLERCDRFSARPHPTTNPLSVQRIFNIYNTKIPVSPICSVKIETNPTGNIVGGALLVDGAGTSWLTPHSEINLSTNPAQSEIQFGLNIDYNLNWFGTVNFTVYHCDGDSCELTYRWRRPFVIGNVGHLITYKRSQDSIISIPLEIDLNTFIENVDIEPAFFSVRFIQGVKKIVATSAETINSNEKSTSYSINANSQIINDSASLQDIKSKRIDMGSPLVINQLVAIDPDGDYDSYIYEWTFYDSDGTEITSGLDSIIIDDPTSVGKAEVMPNNGKSSIINIIPNPVNGLATVNYFVNQTTIGEIAIYDIRGNKIQTLKSGVFELGEYSIDFDGNKLQQGTYFIHFSDGKMTDTYKFNIQR